MIKRSVSPSASKYTSPESRAREFPSKAREMKLHLFWAASLFIGNFGFISLAEDCKNSREARNYRGNLNKTRGGLECQRWDQKAPHRHRFSPKSYPKEGLEENYCRNPDGESEGPWCYTTSTDHRWDYCYIPLCKPDTCKLKPKGSSYRGNESKTRKGVTCQKWDAQQPHSHGITPYTHKNAGLDKNFCRNPDGEPGGPWCYTTSPDKRWAYCDVLLCDACAEVKCPYYGKCTTKENGAASCECQAACPLIYKPVCGSDAATYPNQCVLEYESCHNKAMIKVVKEGSCEAKRHVGEIASGTMIEGKARLGPNVKALASELESRSCLIVTVREGIYCTKLDDCPDKSIATKVIRSITMSRSNSIPYEIRLGSNLKEAKYLIEAVLNRGWCSRDGKDDKKWIRDGDYLNAVEYSIYLDKPGKFQKDIGLQIYKEKKPELRNDKRTLCQIKRNLVMVSFPLIDGERQPLIGAYVPQCNEDGSYKEVQCHGSTGYCWCVNDKGVKREETEIRFKTPNCSKDPCDDMKCGFYSKCVVSASGTAECKCRLGCPFIYKPVCGSNGKDYANECVMEYNACTNKTMITVVKKGNCEEGTLGDEQSPIIVEGKVVLGSKPASISRESTSNSCLVVTMRKAIYCTKPGNCPDHTVAEIVIRNFVISAENSIPFKIKAGTELKPARYLIEAVLNRGWCARDGKDNQKWIRGGDYFNDIEHSIEVDEERVYDKDISVREYKEKKPKIDEENEEEKDSECEKERQTVFDSFPVIDGVKRPLLGAFMPQCNEDGSYKEVQCHGSTGYCWCVNDKGVKREETEIRFKTPNCSKDPCDDMKCGFYSKCVVSASGTAECKCRLGCPFIYKPVCGSNGKDYANECVMEYNACTNKTMITVIKKGNCEEVLLPKSKSKCETERQSVFDSFPLIDGKRVPLLGGYMPQCNEDGSYKDVQCQEMFCWCVHQNGTKKEGTEARLAKPNCSTELKSACEAMRQRVYDSFPLIDGVRKPMPGAFVPECNDDGSYKEVQCHRSTGYCWCVNDKGVKREETEVRFKAPTC